MLRGRSGVIFDIPVFGVAHYRFHGVSRLTLDLGAEKYKVSFGDPEWVPLSLSLYPDDLGRELSQLQARLGRVEHLHALSVPAVERSELWREALGPLSRGLKSRRLSKAKLLAALLGIFGLYLLLALLLRLR
jgi:hypothetical protein